MEGNTELSYFAASCFISQALTCRPASHLLRCREATLFRLIICIDEIRAKDFGMVSSALGARRQARTPASDREDALT